MARVRLHARLRGYGFPRSFRVQTSNDGRRWSRVPGLVVTSQPPVAFGWQAFAPRSPVRARFVRVSSAGLKESHAHDVIITKEAPNYRLD